MGVASEAIPIKLYKIVIDYNNLLVCSCILYTEATGLFVRNRVGIYRHQHNNGHQIIRCIISKYPKKKLISDFKRVCMCWQLWLLSSRMWLKLACLGVWQYLAWFRRCLSTCYLAWYPIYQSVWATLPLRLRIASLPPSISSINLW